MDQLIPVIEFLKKNKFWIVCFLLTAAMIGTWFYSTGELKATMDKNLSNVKSKIQAAEGVIKTSAEEGVAAHPNKSTEDGMEQRLAEVTESVLDAWKTRYEAQQKIMVWPSELEKSFVDQFKQYDPPETFPADDTGERLEQDLKMYQQDIPRRMPEIVKIIGSQWNFTDLEIDDDSDAGSKDDGEDGAEGDKEREDFGQGRGQRGENRENIKSKTLMDESDNRIVVKWDGENQQLWLDKMTDFRRRDDHKLKTGAPSPTQIFMLQQDLWLLEAMFQVVRDVNSKMNGDGKLEMVIGNDLAVIKRIDHIAFGREALARLGDIRGVAADDGKKKKTQKIGKRSRGGGKRKKSGDDEGFDLDYTDQPAFHGRYVDQDLEPISADDVRKALTGKTLPAKNLELVVAKRVPVRMAVIMDETRIADFIAACANGPRNETGEYGDASPPFEFEMWQVRINKHVAGEGMALQGRHSGGAGKRGGGKERTRLGASFGGGNAGLGDEGEGTMQQGPALGESAIETRTNYDAKVEFYGIVRIYNPVDEEKLTGKKPTDASKAAKPSP